MTAMTVHAARRGLIDSLPVAVGYLPIAFSFGLTAVQTG